MADPLRVWPSCPFATCNWWSGLAHNCLCPAIEGKRMGGRECEAWTPVGGIIEDSRILAHDKHRFTRKIGSYVHWEGEAIYFSRPGIFHNAFFGMGDCVILDMIARGIRSLHAERARDRDNTPHEDEGVEFMATVTDFLNNGVRLKGNHGYIYLAKARWTRVPKHKHAIPPDDGPSVRLAWDIPESTLDTIISDHRRAKNPPPATQIPLL